MQQGGNIILHINNITVTFTPEVGSPITYMPGDPAIRGALNLYPDPLSSIVLSEQIKQDISNSSLTYANFISTYTGGDKEWWQTTVYLDTPPTLPVGITTITITTPEGETATSTVNVIGTGSIPGEFSGEGSGSLDRKMFESKERIDHFVIEFNGSTIPDAIQVDLVAQSLQTIVKKAHADIANVNWNQSGDNYRIIITPSSQGSISAMSDFKFYMPIFAGATGVTTLSLSKPVQAFDTNGNTIDNVSV